jgi:hypothetical protein
MPPQDPTTKPDPDAPRAPTAGSKTTPDKLTTARQGALKEEGLKGDVADQNLRTLQATQASLAASMALSYGNLALLEIQKPLIKAQTDLALADARIKGFQVAEAELGYEFASMGLGILRSAKTLAPYREQILERTDEAENLRRLNTPEADEQAAKLEEAAEILRQRHRGRVQTVSRPVRAGIETFLDLMNPAVETFIPRAGTLYGIGGNATPLPPRRIVPGDPENK